MIELDKGMAQEMQKENAKKLYDLIRGMDLHEIMPAKLESKDDNVNYFKLLLDDIIKIKNANTEAESILGEPILTTDELNLLEGDTELVWTEAGTIQQIDEVKVITGTHAKPVLDKRNDDFKDTWKNLFEVTARKVGRYKTLMDKRVREKFNVDFEQFEHEDV